MNLEIVCSIENASTTLCNISEAGFLFLPLAIIISLQIIHLIIDLILKPRT